jgi:hypothetical protein
MQDPPPGGARAAMDFLDDGAALLVRRHAAHRLVRGIV